MKLTHTNNICSSDDWWINTSCSQPWTVTLLSYSIEAPKFFQSFYLSSPQLRMTTSSSSTFWQLSWSDRAVLACSSHEVAWTCIRTDGCWRLLNHHYHSLYNDFIDIIMFIVMPQSSGSFWSFGEIKKHSLVKTFLQQCSRIWSRYENLHWLWVWTLSGDYAFFVHQHLSECAHFLLYFFLCVPEKKTKQLDHKTSPELPFVSLLVLAWECVKMYISP